jgi:hypothetical protein
MIITTIICTFKLIGAFFHTSAVINAPLKVLIGDKHAANFIDQYFICCNDIEITENRDFSFETNILGETVPDSIKFKQPETFTPIGAISSGNENTPACGIFTNVIGIAS